MKSFSIEHGLKKRYAKQSLGSLDMILISMYDKLVKFSLLMFRSVISQALRRAKHLSVSAF